MSKGLRAAVHADALLLMTLLYYWAYLYFQVLLPPPEESASVYLITVLPVSFAASIGLLSQLVAGNFGAATRVLDLALLVLASLVVAVAVVRADLPSIRSIGLLVVTLLWLARVRPALPVRVLNGFFCASIVAGGLWFEFDLSEYGLLPGQYADGADRGIEWRVSLFPYVPESGFFALIVFLVNQLRHRGPTRILFCAASLYFLVFSGMRSALLALVLAQVYIFFSKKRRSPSTKATLILLLITAFITSIVLGSFVTFMPSFSGGAIENYFFRTDSFDHSNSTLGHSMHRGWLWMQHLALFMSSPFIGVGTFDFSSVLVESLSETREGSGSESFLTGWLARAGLCFTPFLFYLWLLGRRAAFRSTAIEGSVFLVFCVAALAYGSFLVPYNFMFIVLFCFLLQGPSSPTPPRVNGQGTVKWTEENK
jgi:hypothetical protein